MGVNISPQILSALIAAFVSVLGVIVAVVSARWSIMSAREKVRADTQALRQNLLKDVLAKRMAAYAALWRVFITYDLNWMLEGKKPDQNWVAEFLHELNECNADHGVFFSQSVYLRFVEYRACLADIAQRSRNGEEISLRDVDRLVALAAGTDGKPGLATALKDDLGSYVRIHLQAGASPEDS
ncbi:MAG: hypothetical protein ABSG62_11575 [Terracidiphilus sp.]